MNASKESVALSPEGFDRNIRSRFEIEGMNASYMDDAGSMRQSSYVPPFFASLLILGLHSMCLNLCSPQDDECK